MIRNSKKTKDSSSQISRRDFLGAAAASAAAFTIVPSSVLGANGQIPPSEKLNIAGIGVGGMGFHNLREVNSQNIVALCDVSDKRAADTYKMYPRAKRYKDWRIMLEKQRNIDAVIVATPDHVHTSATMTAIQKGIHVYTQKPLTRTIAEARELLNASRKYKVTTQMGNQGHSGEGIRLIKEWIADGAIGDVHEVHCWTNRPVWPQGMKRPPKGEPIPDYLSWDLWLGPCKTRPYSHQYLPFVWRGWWDFGTGVMGDMGCHIMDPPFWALDLGAPEYIEASSTKVNEFAAPLASIIRYKFAARGNKPSVKLIWWDGGLMPPRPEEIKPEEKMGDNDGGNLFIGEKGKIMCGCYGSSPRIIPETKMKQYDRPPKTLPRVNTSHEMDWVNACKAGKQPSSSFEYAVPLTEVVLLGNVAIRSGEKITWDSKNLKVTNVDEANKYITPEYQPGWTIEKFVPSEG